MTELDEAATLLAMPKRRRPRQTSPSWLGNALFISTLVLAVFFVWTFTVTSNSHWRSVVRAPVLRLVIFVPGAGALASVLLGGYWYRHRDWLSGRVVLVWILALSVALLGVPVACVEVGLEGLHTRNTTWLVR